MELSLVSIISDIVILASSTFLAAISVILRKKVYDSVTRFVKWIESALKREPKHIDGRDVNKNKAVDKLIFELRTLVKADRIQVFQFHNGVMFTSKNPMWKVSCTHEDLGNVASTSVDLQSVLSSFLTDLISPMWEDDGDADYPGITKLTPKACHCTNADKCKYPRGVYFYRVSALKPGYVQGLLSNHKVHCMVLTPVVDFSNNITGFISIDWCWEDANILTIEEHATEICKMTSTIAFNLMK